MSLTNQAPGAEPSMEEILASIRRILKEDEPITMQNPDPLPAYQSAGPLAARLESGEVLVLDSSMLVHETQSQAGFDPGFAPAYSHEPESVLEIPAPPAPETHGVSPQTDHFATPDITPLASPADSPINAATDHGFQPARNETTMNQGISDENYQTPQGLISDQAASATSASLGNLVRTRTERAMSVRAGGPTLDDMVREELRPLLKSWLDANLPALVERIVRAEIERVVGGTAL
jgi:cell pole-organizing protein PopZ